MNYRISSEFQPPFRVYPVIEESSPYKIELVIRVRTHTFMASTPSLKCLCSF